MIDVVVRDARGRPMTDLEASDFELYEDGVRQELGDVTRVGAPQKGGGSSLTGGTEVPPAQTAVSGARTARPTAVRTPTFVALVFDRLTPEARALAYKGALAYVDASQSLVFSIRTIDADRRFHYLLTYIPKNPDFRGEWRKVEVRVPTRKVQVRSRSGYPAVRSLSTIPLLAYEGPALAALERRPPPAELPLRATALQFPMAGNGTRAALLVAASGETLTFATTPEGFRSDFTLLARVKNAGGDVVRKGSHQYRLQGPAADLARTRAGDVLFFRQPELAPGRYIVEAAVHDALVQRAGVTRVALEVPKADGLRVSDPVVVSRTERLLSGELDASNPLQVGDRQIYPTLGEPLRRMRTETVGFYVLVAGVDQTTSARLHVLRDGQTLAELPLALDTPADDGLIRQVGQIPAGGLGTGTVVLRLVVTKGAERVIREAAVRVKITG